MAGEKFVKYKDGKFITDDSGGGGGSSTFAGLDDVSFSNLSNGQVPKYNSTTQKWENSNESGGGQYLPLIYSDEEREVGVWRDGKPLYQKTIVSTYSFHQTGVHSVAIDIHDLDIDTPVSINGFWRRWAGDGNKLWYQYGSEESTYGIGWVRIDSENSYTNGRLAIEIRSDGTDLQIVTLQYTKTTDTPGSGTWTPSGGYAHHYSTTEQVIGTWIDGSTLYEKTIDIAPLPNSTIKEIQLDSSLSKVISMQGYAIDGNDKWNIFFNDCVPSNANASIRVYSQTTSKKLYITTAMNMSSYTEAYITIRYTKSSS